MQMMLNIVKKTSQLMKLKKSITQNDLHYSTDDKHLSDHTSNRKIESREQRLEDLRC